MPNEKEKTALLEEGLYLEVGGDKFKKCPICGGPVENIKHPHFHIDQVTGDLIKSNEAWDKEYRSRLSKLWTL